MKFCKSCGNGINEDDLKCSKCGAEIQKTKAEKSEYVSLDITQIREKFLSFFSKINKKHKRMALAVIIFLALSFAFINVGQMIFTPERFVENFKEAIVNEDVDSMQTFIESSDPRLVINDQTTTSLLNYIKGQPSYFEVLMNNIESQIDYLDSESYEAKSDLVLKKRGRKFFFFDDYVLEPRSYYFRIESNYEGAEIFINDDLVTVISNAHSTTELGPFLPGKYEVKALFSGEYDILETQVTKNVFDLSSQYVGLNLYLEGKYVSMYSDLETELFLNDEKTGIVFSGEYQLGPISMENDAIVLGRTQSPWGYLESQTYRLNEYHSIRFDYDFRIDEMKKEAMEALNIFNQQVLLAKSSKDIAVISIASEDIIQDVDRTISRMRDDFVQVNELKSTFYDLASFDVFYNKDQEVFRISLRGGKDFSYANVNIPTQSMGDIENLEEEDVDKEVDLEEAIALILEDVDQTLKTDYYSYILLYSVNDGSWEVVRAETTWRFNLSEEQRFDF